MRFFRSIARRFQLDLSCGLLIFFFKDFLDSQDFLINRKLERCVIWPFAQVLLLLRAGKTRLEMCIHLMN